MKKDVPFRPAARGERSAIKPHLNCTPFLFLELRLEILEFLELPLQVLAISLFLGIQGV